MDNIKLALKEKLNGLDIYINILNSVKDYQIYNSLHEIEKCQQLKNYLIQFEEYLNQKKLNDNFIIYFSFLMTKITFSFSGDIKSFTNLSNESTNYYYSSIKKNIKEQIFIHLVDIQFVLETLEKLDFYNQNLVFIGANGSGKSSLANNLKQHLNDYCVAISAQRILNIPTNSNIENIVHIQNLVKQKQRKDISNKNSDYVRVITDEFSILLKNLFSEDFVVSRDYRIKKENGEEPEKTKSFLDITIKIWNELISHRIIQTKDGMNLSVKTLNGDEYESNRMSDGEKVILFCIGQVLLAPKNSFIIVDEPELFLNKNIVNKLWDKLETVRDDCRFIYLTHDLDFAVNRNALKFWIKSYDKNHFEFEVIENNEIPEPLVMELLGSQKPILFCEGKNDGKSNDIKILSILFPQFNIKPVDSCFNVINYTKAFNNMKNISIKAYGLIDSDFHSSPRLASLESEGIFNFGFSEIENLCLDEELFKEFANSINSQDNAFEKIKASVFSELEKEKFMQSSQYVNSKIDYYYKDSHINKSKTLDELKTNFNSFNEPIQIEEWFSNRIAEIDKILEEKSYINAIQIFNHKGLIKKANEALEISNYIPRLIRYMDLNRESVKHVLKYFHSTLTNN
ncbi:DUF4435 domain-containing protein [Aliarcobacter cryaerophilus]|uniref:DUF4435 domain-containing protein n=1 Tax=Aliarcobacter cryaerophilus TaxID=28198 RepID=UPI0021B585D7|nr:DUF4435 domain-containing protein [Aliarcobacter cryaerophilus]MCT7533146.1 DUF4435 domain-containing protein [Aliarcobacter cryaerophilus]